MLGIIVDARNSQFMSMDNEVDFTKDQELAVLESRNDTDITLLLI